MHFKKKKKHTPCRQCTCRFIYGTFHYVTITSTNGWKAVTRYIRHTHIPLTSPLPLLQLTTSPIAGRSMKSANLPRRVHPLLLSTFNSAFGGKLSSKVAEGAAQPFPRHHKARNEIRATRRDGNELVVIFNRAN